MQLFAVESESAFMKNNAYIRVRYVAMALSLVLLVGGCGTRDDSAGTQRIAAGSTVAPGFIEPLVLEHLEGPAGNGSAEEVVDDGPMESVVLEAIPPAESTVPANTSIAPVLTESTFPPVPTLRRTIPSLEGTATAAAPPVPTVPFVATVTPPLAAITSVQAPVTARPDAAAVTTKVSVSKTTKPKKRAPTSTTLVSAQPLSTTFASAPAVVPGFDGKTITLAIIGTSTNPIWSNISRAIVAAFEARVATINRRGGIGGRYPVQLVVRDANYDPSATVSEINATKTQVVGYGSILGTPSTEAALGLLRAEQLLASPASQDARWSAEPTLLPVFNSYQIQAINAVAYFLEQAPKSTVCSVSVAGSFGDAGREGTAFAAQGLGAKLGTSITMSPIETNPAAVIGQLRAAGCQGVMTTVTPVQLLNLVMGSARAAVPFRWIAMGASFSDRLITSQTSLVFEQTCWVVGDGPIWGDGTAELSRELLGANHKYWTENPDVGLTFGYAQARVWEAVLERAVQRADLSRAGLLVAATEVKSVDLGGIGSPTDYSQPLRLSAPRASVFAVDGSFKNSIRMLAYNYSAPVAIAYGSR